MVLLQCSVAYMAAYFAFLERSRLAHRSNSAALLRRNIPVDLKCSRDIVNVSLENLLVHSCQNQV